MVIFKQLKTKLKPKIINSNFEIKIEKYKIKSLKYKLNIKFQN